MAIDKIQSESINLADNFVFTGNVSGAGGVNTPAFFARLSSDQSISNETNTIVQFNSEVFDSDSAYDNSTYRFTVPSGEGGKYLFGLGCQFETGAAGRMDNFALRIRVNGSTVIDASDYPGSTTENRIPYKYTSGILNLSAADYVEPAAYISLSSGTPTITNGTLTFYGIKLTD